MLLAPFRTRFDWLLPGRAPSLSAMRYQRAELPLKLDGLDAARSFFAGCFADADPTRESLWVAHVDDEARCVHLSPPRRRRGRRAISRCARSSPTRRAHGSAGIVLAHNHPSGDATPSDADCRATRRLAVGGRSARLHDPRPSGVRRRASAPACAGWGCSSLLALAGLDLGRRAGAGRAIRNAAK